MKVPCCVALELICWVQGEKLILEAEQAALPAFAHFLLCYNFAKVQQGLSSAERGLHTARMPHAEASCREVEVTTQIGGCQCSGRS